MPSTGENFWYEDSRLWQARAERAEAELVRLKQAIQHAGSVEEMQNRDAFLSSLPEAWEDRNGIA